MPNKKNAINLCAIISLALCMSLPLAKVGHAQSEHSNKRFHFAAGPSLGYHTGLEEFFISLNGRAALPWDVAGSRLALNLSLNFYPLTPSGFSAFGAHLDLLYPFNVDFFATPFMGAGLGFTRVSTKVPGIARFSITKATINLKGGLIFNKTGRIQPFAELGLRLGHFDTAFINGGVYFLF